MNANHKILSVIIAYLFMIIIWSTTPLAIKWSSVGVDFITGVSARMLIGTILALILCLLWKTKLPMNKNALTVYAISSTAIYGSMILVYYGAQYISSGLVSVIFGLAPIFTSWFAIHFFNMEKFTLGKFLGAILGIAGLAFIFKEQFYLGQDAHVGIITVLVAVMIHAISAVGIKKINKKLTALQVTTGGLMLSLPLFLITFYIFANPIPNDIPHRTLAAIAYLGIMGSVIGFISYYYVLANLNASTVALATLITPLSALLLGNLFNQESISAVIWGGTGFILLGLIVHQFKGFKDMQWLKRSKETIHKKTMQKEQL